MIKKSWREAEGGVVLVFMSRARDVIVNWPFDLPQLEQLEEALISNKDSPDILDLEGFVQVSVEKLSTGHEITIKLTHSEYVRLIKDVRSWIEEARSEKK